MARIEVFARSYSMVQLSLKLKRVTKSKQWAVFQRVMLVIVLMIWFATVLTSVFFRLSEGIDVGASSMDASTSAGPAMFRSRKLVGWVER